MSVPGEIISLHFGPFANYVGTHLWNLQDELLGLDAENNFASGIHPEVFFRYGEGSSGQVNCNPRALALDWEGSLGGLSLASEIQDESEVISSIAARYGSNLVEVHRQPPIAQSNFADQLERESEEQTGMDEDDDGAALALQEAARDLDAGVNGPGFWTDFLKATLHPRSVLQLRVPWAGPSGAAGQPQLRPLGWGEGQHALARGEQADDLADRVRKFAEECDHLQGLQVLLDTDGAFGGAAYQALTDLSDEYTRVPVILYALQQSLQPPNRQTGQDQAAHSLSTRRWQLAGALSLAHLAPLCSLFIPLSPPPAGTHQPHLQWRAGNRFHASALCASVLDSVSLSFRMLSQGGQGAQDLHSLAHLLAPRPLANIVALEAALPAAALPDTASQADTDPRMAQHVAEPFTLAGVQCWSPNLSHGDLSETLLAESIVLRGARTNPRPTSASSAASSAASSPRVAAAASVASAAAALDASLMAEGTRCIRHRCVSHQPLPIPLPFPKIFSPLVQRYGDITPWHAQRPDRANGHAPPAWELQPSTAPVQTNVDVDVVSVPVLTRLVSSQAATELAAHHLQQFQGAVRSAAGRQLWRSWDYDAQGTEDAEASLHALSSAYDSYDA